MTPKAPRRYPPIPKSVHAPGGEVTVVRVPKIVSGGDECWGIYEEHTRTITLDKTAPAAHAWKVYYHELAHAWLDDSGLSNGMPIELVEALCDAIAVGRMRERFG